ncbi:hypothetical protein B1857_004424 [Salmonella enterica]|nr:hypothetical protein [Salmonella enterica]
MAQPDGMNVLNVTMETEECEERSHEEVNSTTVRLLGPVYVTWIAGIVLLALDRVIPSLFFFV